jgi:hypothetical protein
VLQCPQERFCPHMEVASLLSDETVFFRPLVCMFAACRHVFSASTAAWVVAFVVLRRFCPAVLHGDRPSSVRCFSCLLHVRRTALWPATRKSACVTSLALSLSCVASPHSTTDFLFLVLITCTAPVPVFFSPLSFLCISSSFFLFFIGEFSCALFAFLVLGPFAMFFLFLITCSLFESRRLVLPSYVGPSDLLTLP